MGTLLHVNVSTQLYIWHTYHYLGDCGDPPAKDPEETYSEPADTLEGDTANYTCPPGAAYDELDSYTATLTCNAEGSWGEKPNCTRN